MSLIVEDGTRVQYANSYVTVDEATAYHTLFGNTLWNESVDKQEAALVQASQAVDIIWGMGYASRKATKHQGLLFPRLSFYDLYGDYVGGDEIPQCLKHAVFEMAYQWLVDGSIVVTDAEYDVKKKSQSVGDLQEQIEYMPISSDRSMKMKYSKVDLLLRPIIATPSYSISL